MVIFIFSQDQTKVGPGPQLLSQRDSEFSEGEYLLSWPDNQALTDICIASSEASSTHEVKLNFFAPTKD